MIARSLVLCLLGVAALPLAASSGLHVLGAPAPRVAPEPLASAPALPAYPVLPLYAAGPDGATGHVASFRESDVTWESFSAQGGEYQIQFECPDPAEDMRQLAGCPIHVQDLEDIMGSPTLVVNRHHPNLIAFHALHGGLGIHGLPGDRPPTERSRDDEVHQPHTLFTTTNGGNGVWNDFRYYAPFGGPERREYDDIYGEDQGLALDANGDLHMSTLYATRNAGDAGYTYRLILRKVGPIGSEGYDYSSYTTRIFDAGDRVDQLHEIHVSSVDKVFVVWHQDRSEANAALGGLKTFIDAQWLESKGGWKRLAPEQRIGPCKGSSNPVAVGTAVYVACLPAAGYKEGQEGTWQLHALDAVTMQARHVGQIPLEAGRQSNLVLASRRGDGLVAAAGGLGGDGRGYTKLTFGTTSGNWSDAQDHFDALTNLTAQAQEASGLAVKEVRVSALAWNPYNGMTHLIFVERYEQSGPHAPTRAFVPEFFKRMAAFNPSGSMAGKASLQVGTARAPYEPEYQSVGEGAFSDLRDDIEIIIGPDGQPREFVAYGDFGDIRFAEVVEVDGPGPPFLPFQVQPPIPAPNPGLNPNIVGAVAGALAGAASLRMLAAKKKVTAEAPA